MPSGMASQTSFDKSAGGPRRPVSRRRSGAQRPPGRSVRQAGSATQRIGHGNLRRYAPPNPGQELRDHRETYDRFSRLVLFAVLHIALVLSCMALAFLGHIPVLAVLLGLGGTLALLVAFAVTG